MTCFIHLTEVVSGNLVAINPTKVVCIFTNKDPDSGVETTVVNLVNGSPLEGGCCTVDCLPLTRMLFPLFCCCCDCCPF